MDAYRFKGVKEYRDETGWYTLVNMKDVWQLDMVGRTSAERTGYATQKPETLVRRILESCTEEGSLCADFFGGSGTLAAAAESMGRRWLLCDSSKLASISAQKRLFAAGAEFSVMAEEGSGTADICGFEAECVLGERVNEEINFVCVTLKRYSFPEDAGKLPLEPRYREDAESALRHDSLQFVDYWSVDFCYDGVVFRPRKVMCRDRSGLDVSCGALSKGTGPVAVRVVDIFGNSSLKVLGKC